MAIPPARSPGSLAAGLAALGAGRGFVASGLPGGHVNDRLWQLVGVSGRLSIVLRSLILGSDFAANGPVFAITMFTGIEISYETTTLPPHATDPNVHAYEPPARDDRPLVRPRQGGRAAGQVEA